MPVRPANSGTSAHTHPASDLASGVIAAARLATGTPDGTKFLRDDQTWDATAVTSASIDIILSLTQAAYDAIGTKDARTLYVVS